MLTDTVVFTLINYLKPEIEDVRFNKVPNFILSLISSYNQRNPSILIRRGLRNKSYFIVCNVFKNHFIVIIFEKNPVVNHYTRNSYISTSCDILTRVQLHGI